MGWHAHLPQEVLLVVTAVLLFGGLFSSTALQILDGVDGMLELHLDDWLKYRMSAVSATALLRLRERLEQHIGRVLSLSPPGEDLKALEDDTVQLIAGLLRSGSQGS